MKSSDTTSPEPNNDETDDSQDSTIQSERFDMSSIVEVPRWKRILTAIEPPSWNFVMKSSDTTSPEPNNDEIPWPPDSQE